MLFSNCVEIDFRKKSVSKSATAGETLASWPIIQNPTFATLNKNAPAIFTLYKENFINSKPYSYYLAPGSVYKNIVLFTYYWKVYSTHGDPNRVGDFVVRRASLIRIKASERFFIQ